MYTIDKTAKDHNKYLNVLFCNNFTMCSHTNHQITDGASKKFQYPKNSTALEPLSWGHLTQLNFY